MYLSLGQAAREAGVAKSTSGRTFPRVSENHENQCGGNCIERLATGSGGQRNHALQLVGLKGLIAEKDRRIADLEGDRVQLREDRHRLTENWQEERIRLLKLVEDLTGTVKLLTDERKKLVAEVQRTFWQEVFRCKHIERPSLLKAR